VAGRAGESVSEKNEECRSRVLDYLSLDEVRSAGRTATFAAFGDYLLFHDGAVHVLPHAPDLEKPTELLSHPAVYQDNKQRRHRVRLAAPRGLRLPSLRGAALGAGRLMRQDQASVGRCSIGLWRRPRAANSGRDRCALVRGRNRSAARRPKDGSSRVRWLAMMATRPGAEQ
jgi:hypothetical protein